MPKDTTVDAPTLRSALVPVGAAGAVVWTWSWTAIDDAVAYLFCRVKVPITPEASAGLFAGGLDLMLERYVLPGDVHTVVDDMSQGASEAEPWPHRLVLARHPDGRLSPVAGLLVSKAPSGASADDVEAPGLREVGVLADDWTTPSGGRPGRSPSVTSAGKPAPSFIERPMTVSEGVRMGAATRQAKASKPASPLEAWNKRVKPRKERGGRLPVLPPQVVTTIEEQTPTDSGEAAVATASPEGTETVEASEPRLEWAILASDGLSMRPGLARAAVRRLRGFLKVGLGGIADRQKLQRRADAMDVPVDGIFALAGDHANFANAVGCRPENIVCFVLPEDPTPPGARRIEVTLSELTEAADIFVDELRQLGW